MFIVICTTHIYTMYLKKYLASVSELFNETEEVFSKHEKDVTDAVFKVLKRLVQLTHFISENQI